MGYYIQLVEGEFIIPTENLNKAYKTCCLLNTENHLKRGGRFPKNLTKPSESKSCGDPNFWFAWMDWNYDETCNNLEEILEMLGFDAEKTDEGVTITGYDNKTGDEEIFLNKLAPYVHQGSFLSFEGEDGEQWTYRFNNGKMETMHGQYFSEDL